MNPYKIRDARTGDVDFIVTAIIEAEKSGSNTLSYSTVFNLPETEVRDIMRSMLLEEIDGCEFSLSSYLVAETDGNPVGTIGAWVEKSDAPSKTIKSNLLGYYLPKSSLVYASRESGVASELIIENVKDALSFVIVYIAPEHRGKGLFSLLADEHLRRNKGVEELYIQVMANNHFAIQSYERYGFSKFLVKTCNNPDILNFLPYHEKALMKKSLK